MRTTAQNHRRLVANLTGATDHTERNVANRQEGADFEKRLDGYHAELMATGKAMVMRTNPKIRMTGANRAVVIGKGECDYVALLNTGRLVSFDAKSRTDKAFSVSADFEHQLNWLRTSWGYGHYAGLLVYWKDYGEVRWHSVQTFDKRVRMADGVPVVGVEWMPLFSHCEEVTA